MSIDRTILRLCYDQMETRLWYQKIADDYFNKSGLPSRVFFCIIMQLVSPVHLVLYVKFQVSEKYNWHDCSNAPAGLVFPKYCRKYCEKYCDLRASISSRFFQFSEASFANKLRQTG